LVSNDNGSKRSIALSFLTGLPLPLLLLVVSSTPAFNANSCTSLLFVDADAFSPHFRVGVKADREDRRLLRCVDMIDVRGMVKD